ncbi:hypothetical protein WA158_008177 [Blastocystis sp. Blastoise]
MPKKDWNRNLKSSKKKYQISKQTEIEKALEEQRNKSRNNHDVPIHVCSEPKNIPGFFYDYEKKKYFPNASKKDQDKNFKTNPLYQTPPSKEKYHKSVEHKENAYHYFLTKQYSYININHDYKYKSSLVESSHIQSESVTIQTSCGRIEKLIVCQDSILDFSIDPSESNTVYYISPSNQQSKMNILTPDSISHVYHCKSYYFEHPINKFLVNHTSCILSSELDPVIYSFDITRNEVSSLMTLSSSVLCMQALDTYTSNIYLLGTRKGDLYLWDTRTKLLNILYSYKSPVISICTFSRYNTLCANSFRNKLNYYDLRYTNHLNNSSYSSIYTSVSGYTNKDSFIPIFGNNTFFGSWQTYSSSENISSTICLWDTCTTQPLSSIHMDTLNESSIISSTLIDKIAVHGTKTGKLLFNSLDPLTSIHTL